MRGLWSRAAAYLQRPRRREITSREAVRLIERHGLGTIRGAWHYSWNIDRFYERMFVQETRDHIYVFNPHPIHQWAPAPLFSNDPSLDKLMVTKGKNCPFWMLKLTTFDAFLARRSALSHRPAVHFPSEKTYPRVAAQMNCRVEHIPLAGNEQRFIDWYDALKDPKYGHSGEKCLATARTSNAATPSDWFSVYALIDAAGACKAVHLMISDGRSTSGIQTAAARKSGPGYGVFLSVECIKLMCQGGQYSFDAGVSEGYGGYKDALFLDKMETDSSGELPPQMLSRTCGL